MNERAEREAGRRAKTARFDMQRKGRAWGVGETAGFIKVGVEAESAACSARPRPRTTAGSI